MNSVVKLIVAGAGLALAVGQAQAAPSNLGPPPGAFFSLTGQPLSTSYVNYTTTFVATTSSTFLTFAFRDDADFIKLDDLMLTTGGGSNLLVNGGFEQGPVGQAAPFGFTHLVSYIGGFGGVVASNNPHSGSNEYDDGALQSYDGIAQRVATTPGATYSLSFWVAENSGRNGIFQPLSTNGDVTDTGGNATDLFVYQGALLPIGLTPSVPEPATWALMLIGFGMLGGMARVHRLRLCQPNLSTSNLAG